MKIGSVALALMISLAGTAARSQEVSEYGSTSRGRLPDSTTRFVAQDLIRQVGVDCQVSAALALGRDGNGIPQYEVACADGPGYILVGSSGAINCLGLTARSSSEGRRSPRRHQCRLPGTIAERSGLSVSTIQRIEAGTVDPKVTTLWALAKSMETEIYELADVSGDELGIAADETMQTG